MTVTSAAAVPLPNAYDLEVLSGPFCATIITTLAD
jgi:hypothetical protein